MKRIRIPFLVVVFSLMVTGMAFAVDIPNISTWTQDMGVGGGAGTGLGDLLIAPLYDVRGLLDPNIGGSAGATSFAQQTLIAIVNTDDVNGVIARIRFREWKRSREVLDFDIPLTTHDVWVAQVARLPLGGAVLTSPDRWVSASSTGTFTAPLISATDFGLGVGNGIPFRTFAIESGETNPLARTEYGYFEIIGEESVGAPNKSAEPWIFPRTTNGSSVDVGNVLMGNVYLIRPTIAISHQFNMDALSNFSVDPAGIFNQATTVFPNLLSAVQGEAGNPGVGGFNQLEAILSKREVDFQYVNGIQDTTPTSTSVVVTFPTKHFHFNPNASGFPTLGTTAPGGAPFTGACETIGDCPNFGEVFTFRIFDRHENSFSTPPGQPISPQPVLTPFVTKLPYEVNIIGLTPHDPPNLSDIISRNNVVLATASSSSGQVFNSGWAFIDLSPDLFTASGDPRTTPQGKSGIQFNFFGNMFAAYRGLPAMGVVMTEFFNASVTGFFGNCVPWQFQVDWLVP